MKKKILFLTAVLLFFAVNSFADTIILKSGKQVEGTILEREDNFIKVDFGDFSLTYFLDEIDTINGEKVSLSAGEAEIDIGQESTAEVVTEGMSQPEQIGEDDFLPAGEYSRSPEVFPEEAPQPEYVGMDNSRETGFSEGYGGSQDESARNMALFAGIMFIAFIFFVIFYIYGALCLQFIAKKTSQEPVWMAWVPIANLFLMCRVAGLSYWWLLILLTSFIPILGPIANAVFFAFLWYKIALARNKPGWIGALAFLPLINIIVIGYLAFSD